MKEFATAFIGMAFATAFIVFFGMGKIPLDLFGPVATGAIVWFFKERELQATIRRLKK